MGPLSRVFCPVVTRCITLPVLWKRYGSRFESILAVTADRLDVFGTHLFRAYFIQTRVDGEITDTFYFQFFRSDFPAATVILSTYSNSFIHVDQCEFKNDVLRTVMLTLPNLLGESSGESLNQKLTCGFSSKCNYYSPIDLFTSNWVSFLAKVFFISREKWNLTVRNWDTSRAPQDRKTFLGEFWTLAVAIFININIYKSTRLVCRERKWWCRTEIRIFLP